jgi:hypothetical protein
MLSLVTVIRYRASTHNWYRPITLIGEAIFGPSGALNEICDREHVLQAAGRKRQFPAPTVRDLLLPQSSLITFRFINIDKVLRLKFGEVMKI